MTPNTNNFNPQELCSRKLIELIDAGNTQQGNKAQLQAAIAELEERRGHLLELQNAPIGKDKT